MYCRVQRITVSLLYIVGWLSIEVKNIFNINYRVAICLYFTFYRGNLFVLNRIKAMVVYRTV